MNALLNWWALSKLDSNSGIVWHNRDVPAFTVALARNNVHAMSMVVLSSAGPVAAKAAAEHATGLRAIRSEKIMIPLVTPHESEVERVFEMVATGIMQPNHGPKLHLYDITVSTPHLPNPESRMLLWSTRSVRAAGQFCENVLGGGRVTAFRTLNNPVMIVNPSDVEKIAVNE